MVTKTWPPDGHEFDRRFLHAFETGALPEEDFRRRDHVRAAWLLLHYRAETLGSDLARRVFLLPDRLGG